MQHILFFLLAACVPFSIIASKPNQPVDRQWLEYVPVSRFSLLTNLSPQSIDGYHEKLIPYLSARGVNDAINIENFAYKDLLHIAHALSILFEQEPANVLHNFLGEHYSIINGFNIHIDHVGRELFGPLSFYLPLLDLVAPQLGLIHIKDIIFPSTQVVKVLQQYDPTLRGVTIGRIYFQSIHGGKIRCLELFQASPQDEQYPQKIEATETRLSLLTTPYSNSLQVPIDHLALELSTIEDVQKIHDRIHQLSSETLRPYQEKISYNPGDSSTQTKVLLRDSKTSVFNKIIEFVHYQQLQPKTKP